jgi:hypothetical protein
MDISVVPSPGERQPIPVDREAIDRKSVTPLELAMVDDELSPMLIGQRLQEIRESKNFGQGEIERRAGLLRPYSGSRISAGSPTQIR